MIYVALLRGINVGGKNKLDMRLLKQTFTNNGMKNVKTYLNTGNVIFQHDDLPANKLPPLLEEAIYNDFGMQLNVLVRSIEEFQIIIEALPESWTNGQQMKSDVLFLWEDIDDLSLLDRLPIKPEMDTVYYVPGAILWSIDRKDATKTGLLKLVGTDLYKKMTIRNVNTARKIYRLMQEAAGNV